MYVNFQKFIFLIVSVPSLVTREPLHCIHPRMPVRLAQGVEAWPDSTRLVQRIAGSNPASAMDVCVRLCVCNLKQ